MKIELIEQLIMYKVVNISKLQRFFTISYPKAKSILDNFLIQGVVEKVEQGYLIIKEHEFAEQLNRILEKYGY